MIGAPRDPIMKDGKIDANRPRLKCISIVIPDNVPKAVPTHIFVNFGLGIFISNEVGIKADETPPQKEATTKEAIFKISVVSISNELSILTPAKVTVGIEINMKNARNVACFTFDIAFTVFSYISFTNNNTF